MTQSCNCNSLAIIGKYTNPTKSLNLPTSLIPMVNSKTSGSYKALLAISIRNK